ncbi:MAG TPA: hypothetical protein VHP14_21330 [Anaerolineales bacterium]|nr:hypothetical protein [Anaerolineales bacterium]
MKTFELVWRGSIAIMLASLAWLSFATGSMLAGVFLLLCIPAWLFIGLYNVGYF